MTEYCISTTEVANSIELRFLIDRHIVARHAGQHAIADVYARAAEGVLRATLRVEEASISAVASRKGDGRSIARDLARHLSPASAAAVNVIWLLRGARRPAIDALSEAFRHDVVFNDTIRMLCSRVLLPSTTEPVKPSPIEMAAAYRR